MSSSSRAERRRLARRTEARVWAIAGRLPSSREAWSVAGWGDVRGLSSAQRRTAETLTELMGLGRVAPVRVGRWAGDDAVRLLADMRAGVTNGLLLETYDAIGDLLAERGGWLVVAAAAGRLNGRVTHG